MPRPFQPIYGDPETTLRRFEIFYEGMWKKPQLLLMIGREEVQDILTYTGKQETAGAAASFTKVFNAKLNLLKGSIWLRMASQCHSTTRVLKAAKKVDWAAYTAEKAARDVIIRGCDADKLRVKPLQENPELDDLISTAISMENAQNKSKQIINGSTEAVRRLKTTPIPSSPYIQVLVPTSSTATQQQRQGSNRPSSEVHY